MAVSASEWTASASIALEPENAKPINFAKYAARIFSIQNLRPSFDDLSIEPYKSIAFEIYEEFGGKIDALFMFPTSASSLIGIAKGFLHLMDVSRELETAPRIVAVQTGAITSIASKLKDSSEPASAPQNGASQQKSAAGALGVKVTRRTKDAVEIIKRLNGAGVIVSPQEIAAADAILRRHGIITSEEGAASFAGVMRLKELKNVVCLLTGRKYEESEEIPGGNLFYAESYTDVKKIGGKLL